VKLVDNKPREIEGAPSWVCLGIAEDAGRTFIIIHDTVSDKRYIEEVVCKLSLDASKLDLKLQWIEDETLWETLHKFFSDNIIWKRVIDINKIIAERAKL
jgi:hypothetical protein